MEKRAKELTISRRFLLFHSSRTAPRVAKKKSAKPVKRLAEPLRPTNRLEKRYHIRAAMHDVFRALTDERLVVEWSGDAALMDATPGGEFSLWGGSIHGVNRVVTPTRIEQDWKEEEWKYPSNVVFTLSPHPEGGTLLELVHEGIPSLNFKAIDAGWDADYLGPLQALVEGR